MKINTAQGIVGYDDEPAAHPNGDVVTVKWAIQMILNTPCDSMPWTPDAMLRCAELSRVAYKPDADGFAEFGEADAKFILARAAALAGANQCTPLMNHYLIELFDDAAKEV